jgi:hypothetical protein
MNRRLLQIDEEMRACRAELRGMWDEHALLQTVAKRTGKKGAKAQAAGNTGKVLSTIDKLDADLATMPAPDSLMIFVKSLLVYVLSEARKLKFESDSLTAASRAKANSIVGDLKTMLSIVPIAFSSLSNISESITIQANAYIASASDASSELLVLFNRIGTVLSTGSYGAGVSENHQAFLKGVGTILLQSS